MFRVPGETGKGVLVSPVVFGNTFIGLNATPASKGDAAAFAELARELRAELEG